ncbi:NAD(P)-dependent oxidoreductase [Amycolatopsis orientalis]|uniref:NAD(P)-dependent oxidoreductase n=1 Tax=Amycolatopsis orientalis TaxID=31958 RepID=UPI0003A016D7|nr:NAD(P)H-binding protein [Amycolatopsis orientalis]
MSSLAVVAATGRTGRLVVERALAAGHEVTAIAREPGNLGLEHPRLIRRSADALDPESLRGALAGHEVVVSALGSTGRRPTTVYSAGTASIVSVLPPGARLVVISSAGLATPRDAGLGTRAASRILRWVLRHPYADMVRMEELLARTGLAWTAVRPSGLTDRPGTGRARVSVGSAERLGPRTARADLAAYVVDHLDDRRIFGRVVAVSS